MKVRVLLLALGYLMLVGVSLAMSPSAKIVPPPAGGDALEDFVDHLRVGPAHEHANLVLFPIFAPRAKTPAVDLSFDKAIALDLIEVSELASAQVNRVRIRNLSKKPIFIMAGEMLQGGKQDRIIGDDLILPAKAELVIPVFCVEQGRWAGAGERFSPGHSLAGAGVRGGGMAGGQEAVWSKVAEQQQRLRAPSPTGALRSVHDSVEVKQRMKPYLRALSHLPDDYPKMSGVVAAVEGEILAADLFSSPGLFRQLWPDLLAAYVVDALERSEEPHPLRLPERTPPPITSTRIQLWLNGLRRAERMPKDTPGEGDLYELRGRHLTGSALVWDRGVVHVGLFPKEPIYEPEFNSLKFRRERLQEE